MARRTEYRHKKVFATSFEEDLIVEFTKQCQKEGKDRNQVLTKLIEQYLIRSSSNENEQTNISIFNTVMGPIRPSLTATKQEWYTYWQNMNDIEEIAMLEGVFITRREEAKNRYYQLKLIKTEPKVYK
jgi:hypothetical protein